MNGLLHGKGQCSARIVDVVRNLNLVEWSAVSTRVAISTECGIHIANGGKDQ